MPGPGAEAKQRKTLDPSELELVHISSSSVLLDVDTSKNRRTLISTCRDQVVCVSSVVGRRWMDALCMGFVLAFEIVGHHYVLGELLQPRDSFFVILMRPVGVFINVLFLTSWAAVIFYGPGRVPSDGTSSLPVPLAAAMSVGQFNKCHPFGPEDGVCRSCAKWKPALATIVPIVRGAVSGWTTTAILLASALASEISDASSFGCATLRSCSSCCLFSAFVLAPFISRTVSGGKVRITLFSVICLGVVWAARNVLQTALVSVSGGWTSAVLESKFLEVVRTATAMKAETVWPSNEEAQEFQSAISGVRKNGSLKSPVAEPGVVANLVFVFGEPVSWRWCLPLVPGGLGDPLQPSCDVEACRSWSLLANGLQKCTEACSCTRARLETAKLMKRAADDEWKRRVKSIEASLTKVAS
eukprot:CAMPEP_0194531640 /NCGR_PEP_ID=MMETSP0253-20130528/68998_1 /TAXON_ID=2966 /ORGANISM="Noctiluca scintillans" /LENGTH=413 /DNA_ID=CAMNT_0039377009 /DNA_START=162 /DNA_END=1403 /DNA_ORIENTATION=-